MDESDQPVEQSEQNRNALEEEESGPLPAWVGKTPPPSARCAKCGSSELSSVPAFALGSGIAYRPIADDVYCRRCGHMAPPK